MDSGFGADTPAEIWCVPAGSDAWHAPRHLILLGEGSTSQHLGAGCVGEVRTNRAFLWAVSVFSAAATQAMPTYKGLELFINQANRQVCQHAVFDPHLMRLANTFGE